MGVYYRNSSGDIDNLAVKNIKLAPADFGCQSGLGIFVQSGNGRRSRVDISDSSVHDYQKNGITANEAGTEVNISGNTVTGIGPTPQIAQNGIQLAFGAKGTVEGNSVINHVYSLCTSANNCSFSSSNILIFEGNNVRVVGNNLGNSQVNVYYGGNRGEVRNNTIFQSPSLDGIDLVGNQNRAFGNRIFNSDEAAVRGGHRRCGGLQPGEGLAVGLGELVGDGRLEHREGLPELHRATLELAQHGEELLGAAARHVGGNLARIAAREPPAPPGRRA